MLSIGEFSKISHLTLKTLRHYDEIGSLLAQTLQADIVTIIFHNWKQHYDYTLKKLFIYSRRNIGYFN
ncbi:hypothetical protein LSPCS325_09480 [Lysinibacillus sp. CTST325]